MHRSSPNDGVALGVAKLKQSAVQSGHGPRTHSERFLWEDLPDVPQTSAIQEDLQRHASMPTFKNVSGFGVNWDLKENHERVRKGSLDGKWYTWRFCSKENALCDLDGQ